MKRTDDELVAAVKALETVNKQIEMLKENKENLEQILKDEMSERNLDTLKLLGYIVRWTAFTSLRFDSKKFKFEQGEQLYNQYCKEVSSKRFSIN